MEKVSKRFEEWEEVDCNECERWWINQCDGATKGSRIGCNSYLATRSIVIPERLNSLEKRVKWLEWVVGFGFIILGVLAILGR